MLRLRFAPGDGPAVRPQGRLVNTWRDEAGAVQATAYVSGATGWIEWPQLGTFEFDDDSMEVRVSAAPGAPRDVIETTFARSLQPIILQAIGWEALHASAVATTHGVMAFCGRAGAGKSTLAAALARQGHPQLADDALVFTCRDDRVRVEALPFEPQITTEARARLDAAPGQVAPAAAAAAAGHLLVAVFLLAPWASVDARPAVARLSAVEAFSAILPHAHCFDDGDRRRTEALVQSYLALAAQVPVYSLAFPLRWERLPEVVAAVLGTERRRDPTLFPGVRRA